VVLSTTAFNVAGTRLAVVVPLTTKDKNYTSHIRIEPDQAGLRFTSFAMCEAIRSMDRTFLIERWGSLPPNVLGRIASKVAELLGIVTV
jgi:mRNA-degrading endonuclease toxin of MazEF toxin-antitoxin module